MKRHFILFVVVVFSHLSCKRSIDKTTYFQWMTGKGSGLHQQVEVGRYLYDIQYKPVITDSILKSKESIIVDYKQLQDSTQEYHIKISSKIQGKTLITDTLVGQTYQDRTNYFSYQFAKDIYLIQEGKKYNPVFCHAEQLGEIYGSSSFIVVFNALIGKDIRYLCIKSPNLGIDTIKIKFNPLLIPKP
jgi:hypothetical protein